MATRTLQVVITGDAKSAGRAFDKIDRSAKHSESRLHRFGAVGAKSFAAIGAAAGGAAVVGLTKSAKAAIEAEKSQAKLRTQLKAAGISYKDHAKEIDRVIDKTSKLSGLDDEDLQDSFTNIVRVTGDVNKALKLNGLAADFARAKHIDVAKAGEIVGKVAGGNTGILGRYGIVIDKNATSSEALAALQKKFSGQAEGYGKTTAGSLDRMSVASENLGEKVGGKLTPMIAKAADKVADFIDQMQDGRGKGGRFAKTLENIADKVRPVVKFFKDHPKLIAAAVAAWGLYKLAVVTTVIAGRTQAFRKMFLGGGPAATRAGAVTGAAYSSSFAATSSRGVTAASGKGGRLGRAMTRAGRGLGATMGIAAGAMFAVELAKAAENALGDIAPGGLNGKRQGGSGNQAHEPGGGSGWNLFDYVKNAVGDVTDDVGQRLGEAARGGGQRGGRSAGAQTGNQVGLQVPARRGLSYIREHFGGVSLSSGWRSKSENARVGGAPNSDHLTGLAIDLVPSEGWTAKGTARLDRIAAWARKSPTIRWIGWRGVPGHGPGDHLHLSFMGRALGIGQRGVGDVAMGPGGLRAYGGKVRGAGDVGYNELKKLWTGAGGPAGQADTAAAVALAESGGRAGIVNSIGAGGLWQIHPPEAGYLNPKTNARIAVRKYKESGWQPWEAYTGPDGKGSDGPWRRFLRGGGGARSGGGAAGAFGRHMTSQRKTYAGAMRAERGLSGPSSPASYEQGLANVDVDKAKAQAKDSLPALIKALGAEKALKRRRLKKVNRTLKRRIRKATRQRLTEEKAQLIADLAELTGLLKEYRADAAGGATTISGAEELDAGVAPDGGGGDAGGGPSAADLALAEASLTLGLEDDIAATERKLGDATNELNQARASGDTARIISAIEVWKSVKDSLDSLKAALNNEAETRQRLIDELAGLRAEVKAQNELSRTLTAVGYREALKWMADSLSGQIVGTNLQGRRQTAGNGVIAMTP